MRVGIAGAGLAGLLLAQGLRQAGVEVVVFERDAAFDSRSQGYRITADEDGFDALRAGLPAELYAQVEATSGPPGGFFRITNERLRDAVVVRFDPAVAVERQVDRATLRAIMLQGLEGRVRWGRPVERIVDHGDTIQAVTSDGSVEFDFFVAADGVGSRLRRDICPLADPVQTGVGGIYGRAPLYAAAGATLPDVLMDSGVLAMLPPPGLAFFMTAMRFPAFAQQRSAATADYVMWGYIPPARMTAGLVGRSAAELLTHAETAVATAHPVIRRIVAASHPPDTLFSRFVAGRIHGPRAIRHAAVIGDAVHPMPPLGSHGGNTALRDAALLTSKLTCSAERLDKAADDFHSEMTAYAAPAIADAERQTRRLTRGGVGTLFLRKVLPLTRRRLMPED